MNFLDPETWQGCAATLGKESRLGDKSILSEYMVPGNFREERLFLAETWSRGFANK